MFSPVERVFRIGVYCIFVKISMSWLKNCYVFIDDFSLIWATDYEAVHTVTEGCSDDEEDGRELSNAVDLS